MIDHCASLLCVSLAANRLQQQREEYAERGISLMHFEKNINEPHLFNVDEDAFRSKRFCYKLTRQMTVFGPGGDVQPMSLEVVRKHCSIEHGTEAQVIMSFWRLKNVAESALLT